MLKNCVVCDGPFQTAYRQAKTCSQKCRTVYKKTSCRTWHEENKDAVNAQARQRRRQNPDHFRAMAQRSRERHLQKHKDRQRVYRSENKERLRAKKQQYYETNREKIQKYRQATLDRDRVRQRERYSRNPDYFACHARKSRAERAAALAILKQLDPNLIGELTND